MMDAYAAWHIFEQTGKVEDYIRYSQMKSLEEFNSQGGYPCRSTPTDW